ncbi:hypothetical protein [Moorena sp. SIO4A5]|uniref:hypothetical protein n=1 Tax=Moorena sp. SIO4A5 TaxID=2607838 RepID=UPI0013C8E1E6|nr:hypothetical protein [Moorena sp. SIO4A5]NEO24777.1 hypothetical protein [Moorena sp. SIO4A5]
MLNKEKTTSNSEFSLVDEKQLFTELTSEEAAVIEGGLTLKLYSIKALKANADWGRFNRDDTYILVNGRTVWGVHKMKTGQTRNINKFVDFNNFANIQLFDRDFGKDDFMGGFIVNQPTGGKLRGFAWGSGSTYALIYEVV